MNTSEASQAPLTGSPAARTRKSVMISPASHRLLEKMAKQFQVKNNEFVEAAIGYFHETGQSPFAAGNTLLTEIESKVEQQALETQQHNADIGNQLGAIMRDVERGLGRHLQEQQGGTMQFLHLIERNILAFLTRLEEKLLMTLLKQVIGMGAETNLNRSLLEILLVKHDNQAYPLDRAKLRLSAAENDKQLDALTEIKRIEVSDATRLTPVRASQMPAVAAPQKPSLLPPKKSALGGQVVRNNPPSEPDSAG